MIKSLLYSILKNFLENQAGLKKRQYFFERLHEIALKGMNFGNGAEFALSGELVALEYIKSKLSHEHILPLVLFDVGANSGNYSLKLQEIFSPIPLNIYSFEAAVDMFKILQGNTQIYPQIRTFHQGISHEKGSMQLFKNQSFSGLSSLYQRRLQHFNLEMNETETVQLTSIDEFCQQEHINRIDFLKLDIEGHELKALQGAKKMIQSNKIRFIQFEFGGCNIDSRTYFQDFYYLLKDKYNLYRIVKDGLYPITHYREIDEIFTTINYLAELKIEN
jgi:FkbM family methyltransferase